MLSKPERRLRIKIWIVIAIAVSITGGAVFWSYESFKELTNSIERLSQPNEKLQVINNILQDFISAENNIQSYIITGNVPSARIYERQIEEARKGIASEFPCSLPAQEFASL
jgi:CHASE3 domain sensor protein